MAAEIAGLRKLTVAELQQRCRVLFGHESRCHHRDWLFKKVAFRMQGVRRGGLSERTKQRAREFAKDSTRTLSTASSATMPTPAESSTRARSTRGDPRPSRRCRRSSTRSGAVAARGASANIDYILQGVLYCACENKMGTVTGTGRNGTVHRYYRCYGQTRGPASICDHPRVTAADIEPLILDKIREVCADPAVRGEVAKRLQWGKEQSGRAIALERDVIQKKIDEFGKEAPDQLTFVRPSGKSTLVARWISSYQAQPLAVGGAAA